MVLAKESYKGGGYMAPKPSVSLQTFVATCDRHISQPSVFKGSVLILQRPHDQGK